MINLASAKFCESKTLAKISENYSSLFDLMRSFPVHNIVVMFRRFPELNLN